MPTTLISKKLIHVPAQYHDPAYRRRIYEQWMGQVLAVERSGMLKKNSPYYAHGLGGYTDGYDSSRVSRSPAESESARFFSSFAKW